MFFSFGHIIFSWNHIGLNNMQCIFSLFKYFTESPGCNCDVIVTFTDSCFKDSAQATTVLIVTCVYNMYLFVSFSHLSSVLGNKFDHGAEAIVPVLFNLIPNCAKVMATSGVSAIRIIIRVSFPKAHECKKVFDTL